MNSARFSIYSRAFDACKWWVAQFLIAGCCEGIVPIKMSPGDIGNECVAADMTHFIAVLRDDLRPFVLEHLVHAAFLYMRAQLVKIFHTGLCGLQCYA